VSNGHYATTLSKIFSIIIRPIDLYGHIADGMAVKMWLFYVQFLVHSTRGMDVEYTTAPSV